MNLTEQLRFWFEQLGLPPTELAIFLIAALIFSPLPRLIVVFSAIRLGFNGFPGKFVSFSLALALSLVQMEPVLSPILQRSAELSKGAVSIEQRQSLLKFSESQWTNFVQERTLPRYKELIEKLPLQGTIDATTGIAPNLEVSIGKLAVSFLLSEMDHAFRMALIIILPLLIIELLVSTTISALDLKIEAELISFPLKLALFLSTSGWSLITETLLKLN